MGTKTGISWTDATWNPVTGCTKVSAGCDHCYAEIMALRLQRMGAAKYRDGFAVRTHDADLRLPLKWHEPRRIFVNSMSDLFHADIPRAFVDRVFAVTAIAAHHTFQVLTKRPRRAANYLGDPETPERILAAIRGGIMPPARIAASAAHIWERWGRYTIGEHPDPLPWPLRNVWLGTSVEDARAKHRIDALGAAPAETRFLSCEPLIGDLGALNLAGIHWVIVGGESGAQFRPMDPEWARSIRDQCRAADVPFYYKQSAGIRSGMGDTIDGRAWREFPDDLPAIPF